MVGYGLRRPRHHTMIGFSSAGRQKSLGTAIRFRGQSPVEKFPVIWPRHVIRYDTVFAVSCTISDACEGRTTHHLRYPKNRWHQIRVSHYSGSRWDRRVLAWKGAARKEQPSRIGLRPPIFPPRSQAIRWYDNTTGQESMH